MLLRSNSADNQHAGHSRTVVGYELAGKDINLLVFDPGKWVERTDGLPTTCTDSSQVRSKGRPRGWHRSGSKRTGHVRTKQH